MIVNVTGHGAIKFPDTMSEAEVRAVLKQFEPKKDETLPKLIKALEGVVKAQKPLLVKETEIKTIPIQTIVPKTEIQTVTVERIVEVPRETTAWHFRVDKDDDGYDIYARPIDG